MTTSATTPPELPADVGLLDVPEEVDLVVLRRGHGEDSGHYPPGTFRKIVSGMVTMLLLIAGTYLVPGLEWARPWVPGQDPMLFWNLVGRELLGEGAQAEAAAEKLEEAERLAVAVIEQDDQAVPLVEEPVIEPPPKGSGLPPYEPHADDAEPVPRSLELTDPAALDSFYERLARTDARYAGAITRMSMWGDSVVANDNVSSALRFAMQRRFGDAGHGFHLVAKPNASYRHRGVRFTDGETWSRCYIINKCRPDGFYGLGGTTVWSAGGAESRFRTEAELAFGRKISRFEVWYRAQPKGGNIRVKVDGGEPQLIATAAEVGTDAWQTFELTDDAHDISLRAAGAGQVRLYGVVLERDVPGVVVDGMEQLGAFANRMLYFDAEHLRQQVEHRDPALLVFMFGGNDLLLQASAMDKYEQDFAAVIRRFRGGERPPACLVMAPVDHGQREGQRVVSRPMVPKIVEVQRKVALREGCAFFDTVAAMGGEGSAARWRRSDPPLLSGDLAHLTFAGQKVIGQMVYLALMEGYVAYRKRVE
ncbi:GDSL-type esterase/lipase family protein [Paraliomyxa miuraensis]|uniref:GDSL-type esterase/lipase family protein n=1 Tax=Paraliomyxa miuraensis TaxID=376150 RepID=UPI002258DEB1|nr:GDSL-type esterase/lipase family protein [Paraliomyxa miuraensis]MCX4246718.1 GDSL-type esterase/lipase family protein [Paraliomyxa miuraensis]